MPLANSHPNTPEALSVKSASPSRVLPESLKKVKRQLSDTTLEELVARLSQDNGDKENRETQNQDNGNKENIQPPDVSKEIRNLIKAKEKRAHLLSELWIYLGIVLSLAATLVSCYFILPFASFLFLVFPVSLVSALGLAALNYIKHSHNSKTTMGRGVAFVIALTTALLAFVSANAFFALPYAILFASGCFLANLYLYRANVPKVLNSLFDFFADIKKDFQKLTLKSLGEKIFSLKAGHFVKPTWEILSISAALITGFVLTVGMWHSWNAGIILLATPALASFLTAPYVFLPLMAIAFLANCAFVYRGLCRTREALQQAKKVYHLGLLVDNTKNTYLFIEAYSPGRKLTGLQAVIAHYLGLKPRDRWHTIFLKSFFHIFIKLAIVVAITIISQKALVDMNMLYISEVLPWAQNAALLVISNIAIYTAYGSRMSFVLLDLLKVIAYAGQFLSSKEPWKKMWALSWQIITLQWAKPENLTQTWKKWKDKFNSIVREQTQDNDLNPVWQAYLGDQWKIHWEKQIAEDWAKTPAYKKYFFYPCRAVVVIAFRSLIWPALVLNTIANGLIVMFKGGAADAWDNPNSSYYRATANAAASGALVAFSERTVTKESDELYKPEVTIEETPRTPPAKKPIRRPGRLLDTSPSPSPCGTAHHLETTGNGVGKRASNSPHGFFYPRLAAANSTSVLGQSSPQSNAPTHS